MRHVITNISKRKMVQARKGEIILPIVKGIAIGDGAETSTGALLEPSSGDNRLKSELIRKEYSRCERISDDCYCYRINLGEHELAGKKISEAALYDAEGDLLAISVFPGLPKEDGMEMSFEYKDKFDGKEIQDG